MEGLPVSTNGKKYTVKFYVEEELVVEVRGTK